MPEQLKKPFAFPKAADFPKAYEPQLIEQRWAKNGSEEQLFRADANAPGPGFFHRHSAARTSPARCTSATCWTTREIDILSRWRRMRGYNTLYLPGTDHAGISTQRVVVRQLAAQGINYRDLGREEFERRVWEWKEESGGTITRQMVQLGESCDWTRERFTLSPELSRAVTEVFVRLYEDGPDLSRPLHRQLVPAMPHGDQRSRNRARGAAGPSLAHSLSDRCADRDEYVVVATTRPETMLGDTAVAVHPSDPRYQHLIGKMVLLPLMNREIPIIDDFVRGPRIRHRRGEGHARARSERLRNRPPPQPAGNRRDDRRRAR